MMGPIIEKVGEKLKEEGHEVSIYKFNIEEDKEMAASLGVRSIPALKGFNGGENVVNKVGVISESQLIDMANSVL
jgi:thioredoxin-like negative regulator of GroEL